MSNNRLPVRVNPFQLAEKGVSLRGTVPVSSLRRLQETGLSQAAADVAVRLEFKLDPVGLTQLSGQVEVLLKAVCQRCLGSMDISVNQRFELTPVRSVSEVSDLPENLESLEVLDDTLFIQDLVEDELLLSIPTYPAHADVAECDKDMLALMVTEKPELDKGFEDHPFAVLQNWKQDMS